MEHVNGGPYFYKGKKPTTVNKKKQSQNQTQLWTLIQQPMEHNIQQSCTFNYSRLLDMTAA